MKDDLDNLMVKPGDPVRAEDHNALVRAVGRRHLRGGPGVKVIQLDTVTLVSYDAPSKDYYYPWMARWVPVPKSPGEYTFRFIAGLVNGLEPTDSEGNLLSEKDFTLSPKFDTTSNDCLIYLQVIIDPARHNITDATMIATDKKPAWEPWTAYKLIAVANQKSMIITPATYFNLGFKASNVKSTGIFTSWWWTI